MWTIDGNFDKKIRKQMLFLKHYKCFKKLFITIKNGHQGGVKRME